MKQQIEIDGLNCLYATAPQSSADKIVYILYPMDMLGDWIEPAAARHGANIVVITGMDWQNVFSPWPAPGVPKGTPDFKGEAPEFLKLLQQSVIPQVETRLGLNSATVERTLVGVSMSGLFALWQWMVCDTFRNIASLSGSFWYEGFVDWMKTIAIPPRTGNAFFLLGDLESRSNVPAFNTVAADTRTILTLLNAAGLHTRFLPVPGNHFANPIPRLNAALLPPR